MAENAPKAFRRQLLKAGEGWIGDIPFLATLADGRELHMKARVRSDRHLASARHARQIVARMSGKMPPPTTWIEVWLDGAYPYPEEISSRRDEVNAQARKWLHFLSEFQRPHSRGEQLVGQQITTLNNRPAQLVAMLRKDVCPEVGKRLTFSVSTQHYLNLRPSDHIYYGQPPVVTIKSPIRKLTILPPHH